MAAKAKKSAKAKPAKKRPAKARKPAPRGAKKTKPTKVARRLGARQAWAAGDATPIWFQTINLVDDTTMYTSVQVQLTDAQNYNWPLVDLVASGGSYTWPGAPNGPNNVIAVSAAAVCSTDPTDYTPALGMVVWDSINWIQTAQVNIRAPGRLDVGITAQSPSGS